MSRLATDYLQRSFSLPRRVESTERDLSNGYLFLVALEQMGCVAAEDFEQARDETAPELVLGNFRLLARALKKLDIPLSSKAVAGIVSEQAGSAADLIMQIKRVREARESGKSMQGAEFKFRESIKTIRPKPFVRVEEKFDALDADGKFYSDAKSILDNGVFAEIDARTLLGKYETFRHQTDFKVKQEEEQVQREKVAHREEVHDFISTKRKTTRAVNVQHDEAITKNWASTLEIKRQRHVRDLKFELVTQKFAQLKTEKSRQIHDKEQSQGIDMFEINLKRSGMGGGDDDGQTLGVSYEDADAFLNRIDQVAKKNWPTKEDTSDFMTQLKLRTKDKRVARYEKARRRRRMLVEQGLATAALALNSATDDPDAEQRQTKESTLARLLAEKKDKYAKMIESGRVSKETITTQAEEKIQQFAEEFLGANADIEAERKQSLDEILKARAARKAEKHQRNEALIRTLVNDMVSDLFDAGSKKSSAEQSAAQSSNVPVVKPSIADPGAFMHQLINWMQAQLGEFDQPVISFNDVVTLDVWPATSALASNIGKWTFAQNPIVPTLTKEEGEGEGGKKEKGETVSDDVPQEPAGEAQSLPLEVVEESQLQVETTVFRSDSFLEVAQTVLETLLEKTAETRNTGAGGGGEPNFSLGVDERSAYLAKNSAGPKMVVILTDGTLLPSNVWALSTSWLGSNLAFLWDAAAALEVSLKIRPLMEGKTPTVTFASLVVIFFGDRVECPASLIAAALSPSALRTCTELAEMSSRVMSVQATVEAGGELAVASLPFTEATLAILIGTSLWLRNYLYGKLFEALPALYETLPHLAVVAKRFGGYVSMADSAVFLRAVDWFARGGTRDNAPEGDASLLEAVAGEAGKAAVPAKKKPPAKGKGSPDETPPAKPATDVVLLVRHGLVKSKRPEVIVDAEGAGADAGEGAGAGPSILERILDSFAEACWQPDSYSLQAQEEALLEFSKASLALRADGGRAVPVVCLQKMATVQNVAPALISGEDESGLEPTPASSPTSPISVSIDYESEVTVAEALVSVVLSSGSVEVAPSESVAEESIDAFLATFLGHVSGLLDSRRDRLSPSEKIWYLHLTGQHRFAIQEVYATHSILCQAQASETEINGATLLAVEQAMLRVEQQAISREVSLIGDIKTSDPRWQSMCVEEFPKLASAHVSQAKIIVGDLVCRLGDVIDERHMNLLRKLDQFVGASAADWDLLKDALLQISELLCSCAFKIVESKRQAALSVVGLLADAGYADFPWSLPSSAGKGARMLLERRRDDVRAAALMLSDACGATESESGAVEIWKEFSSVETPSIAAIEGSSLSSAALTEVYVESLSSAASLLVAFRHGLEACKDTLRITLSRMSESIRSRHEYEHAVLADWSNKLRRNASTEGPDVSFLSQYHFGVSDDASLDSVAFLSGQGICEARDMTLSLHLLAILSEEIYLGLAAAQQDAVQQDAEVEERKVDDPVEAFIEQVSAGIVAAVKKAIKRDSHFPRSWRTSARIATLVRSVVAKTEETDFVSPPPDQAKLIIRTLITSLALSAIRAAPPADYVSRLAKILRLTSEGGSTDVRQSIPSIQLLVAGDPKISVCWWDSTASEDKTLTSSFISAVAFCCADASGQVVVEDLILELCKSPRRIGTQSFEKLLLLPSGGGPVASEGVDVAVVSKLPAFLHDGIFKALRVASEIVQVEAADELVSSSPNAAASPAASRFVAMQGPQLRQSQLAWLLSAVGQKGAPPESQSLSQWASASRPSMGFVIEQVPVSDPATDSGDGLSEMKDEWVPVALLKSGSTASAVSILARSPELARAGLLVKRAL